MAGLMAAKPPSSGLTLASVGPGVLSDTGGIYNGPGLERGVTGAPIVVPPTNRRYVPPPPPNAVNFNRQAALDHPQLAPSPPPPPLPPAPRMQDQQIDWNNQLGRTPDMLGRVDPKRGILDAAGNQFMPYGAVLDTAGLAGGVEADPTLGALAQFASKAGVEDPSVKALAYAKQWQDNAANLRKPIEDRYRLVDPTAKDAGAAENAIKAGMGPDEKQDFSQLKDVLARDILRDGSAEKKDVQVSLNNVIVQAQYRALEAWGWQQQLDSSKGKSGMDYGGFFNADITGGGKANLYTPNVVLWFDKDSGMYSLKSKADATQMMINDAKHDPSKGGQLIVALLRAKMIPGAIEKYAQDFLRFDPKGNPIAVWPHEYDNIVSDMVDQIATAQHFDKAPDHFVGGVWEQLTQQGNTYQDVANNPNLADHAYGSGGGGGGFRRGGGGGGGFAPRIQLSDPTLLSAQLDSVGKTMLGRILTPAEHADFITMMHQAETVYGQNYYAGIPAVQPDPQSEAMAWINQHYGGEYVAEQSGEYVKALAAFLRGPGLGGGGQ